MKRLLLLTVLLSVLISCGGRKQVEKAVNTGNYDQAISNALNKLKTNKNKKRKQDYIVMLKDAYYKVVERDLETIKHLKKDGNPEQYKTIYEIYVKLNARQEAIKPVLPLQINRKIIEFDFNDYSNEIVEYRYKVSDYLADKGLDLLDSNNKYNAREAYDIFNYIERINPNFEDVRQLMVEAHQTGTDYVMVTIENQTNQIIPARLEEDLLNFDTYGLNQFWTAYHANSIDNINYDYALQLQLKRINISPEQIKEREILREKEIVDGWEYKLDNDGNVVKDSLGNDIKLDKIVNVKARFMEFLQLKSTQIIADVIYLDSKSNALLDTFTIDSEFIFENIFARVRGDKRALNTEDRKILNNRRVPFPSNEQMVYDTGEDLKYKLKDIINSYHIKD
ncbi:MAG: hypothetical protein KAJ28_11045 [Flavobacteriaceae bacterium]|nr:hypothetical protein [Flavobacteriaceae bacterium]